MEGEVTVTTYGKDDLEVCWSKYDRKQKTINFIIKQHGQNWAEKATIESIGEIAGQIDALGFRID